MKISSFISMLVIVGGVMFIMALMTSEGEQKYNVNINKSQWEDRYNYVNDINNSITPLINSFETITDEDEGWTTKILEGVSALPKAVLLIPTLLFSGFSFGGELFTGLLTSFVLPGFLILVALTLMTVWGIFKLIEIFQRWQA